MKVKCIVRKYLSSNAYVKRNVRSICVISKCLSKVPFRPGVGYSFRQGDSFSGGSRGLGRNRRALPFYPICIRCLNKGSERMWKHQQEETRTSRPLKRALNPGHKFRARDVRALAQFSLVHMYFYVSTLSAWWLVYIFCYNCKDITLECLFFNINYSVMSVVSQNFILDTRQIKEYSRLAILLLNLALLIPFTDHKSTVN